MRATSGSTGVTPRSALQAIRAPRTSGVRAAFNHSDGSTGIEMGARSSGPATAASINAVSATVRAIGPVIESGSYNRGSGYAGTTPGEVRKPITPQKLAGILNDPPVSVP